MSKPEITREELLCKKATLETELRHVKKLLEVPDKISTWKSFWGLGVKVVVTVLIVVLFGSIAGAKPMGTIDWRKFPESLKVIYMAGYTSGLMAGQISQELYPSQIKRIIQCTQTWTMGQSVAVVEKYLQEHPEEWDKPFGTLVYFALEKACRKK